MNTPHSPASRPHDAAVVELLKADPDFATEYLAAALDEANQPGGQVALLAGLAPCGRSPRNGYRGRACRYAA